MVPSRFSTDEATVTRVQSDLIIVSYHRHTESILLPASSVLSHLTFLGLYLPYSVIVWCQLSASTNLGNFLQCFLFSHSLAICF